MFCTLINLSEEITAVDHWFLHWFLELHFQMKTESNWEVNHLNHWKIIYFLIFPSSKLSSQNKRSKHFQQTDPRHSCTEEAEACDGRRSQTYLHLRAPQKCYSGKNETFLTKNFIQLSNQLTKNAKRLTNECRRWGQRGRGGRVRTAMRSSSNR